MVESTQNKVSWEDLATLPVAGLLEELTLTLQTVRALARQTSTGQTTVPPQKTSDVSASTQKQETAAKPATADGKLKAAAPDKPAAKDFAQSDLDALFDTKPAATGETQDVQAAEQPKEAASDLSQSDLDALFGDEQPAAPEEKGGTGEEKHDK